jgi:hypothetical protein
MMENVYMERPATPSFVRAIEVTTQNAEAIKRLLGIGITGCTYTINDSKIVYQLTYTDRPDERPHRLTLILGNFLIFEQDGELRPWPILREDFERKYMPVPISKEYDDAMVQQRQSARAYDREFE